MLNFLPAPLIALLSFSLYALNTIFWLIPILVFSLLKALIPIAISHGEGRAEYPDKELMKKSNASGLVFAKFIDNYGNVSETYPSNPNGSPNGITGLTTVDGKVTIMMPHPERVFRGVQNSWKPDDWREDGAWMRMFRNARVWVK